jgi:hypothetical protein
MLNFTLAERLFEIRDYHKCRLAFENCLELLERTYKEHPKYGFLKVRILYALG